MAGESMPARLGHIDCVETIERIAPSKECASAGGLVIVIRGRCGRHMAMQQRVEWLDESLDYTLGTGNPLLTLSQ
jgi:hypothetical protein